MGISWNEFWAMNPRIIKLHAIGHNEKIKEQDYMAWLAGHYMVSAVGVAVEHNLAGKKAKSKYIEKPLLQNVEMQKKELTEEDIKKQRELFVAKLMIMKSNFDKDHKTGERS